LADNGLSVFLGDRLDGRVIVQHSITALHIMNPVISLFPYDLSNDHDPGSYSCAGSFFCSDALIRTNGSGQMSGLSLWR
jgi:hypothetical protein